ncbi:MAG TPA: BMP family ABC transporter substrate-binding protein, partial [Lachnospiraceae bacterium]|nr:BMP family ABC transporter substrate-binding protein [Lachnospiraceae bacterium]
MRKFISVLLAGAMIASTMLGTTVVAHADDDMRVAMITDYGDITDQSFNQ